MKKQDLDIELPCLKGEVKTKVQNNDDSLLNVDDANLNDLDGDSNEFIKNNPIYNEPIKEVSFEYDEIDDEPIEEDFFENEEIKEEKVEEISKEDIKIELPSKEEKQEEKIPKTEVIINDDPPRYSKKEKKMRERSADSAMHTELMIILITIFLIIGGVSTYYLIVEPNHAKPSTITTNKVVKEPGKNTFNLFKEIPEYKNIDIMNLEDDLIIKDLSDNEGPILKVLKNGEININKKNNSYEPLVFKNENIKYVYSFYTKDKFYIISTDKHLYELTYTKNGKYIDLNSINFIRYEVLVDYIELKENSKKDLNIVVTFNTSSNKSIYKILGYDKDVTEFKE